MAYGKINIWEARYELHLSQSRQSQSITYDTVACNSTVVVLHPESK